MQKRGSSGWIFLVLFLVVLGGAGFLVLRELGRGDDLPESLRPRDRADATREEDPNPLPPARERVDRQAATLGDEPAPDIVVDPDDPPLVRGRVVGPDGPVGGATVRMFALSEVYATIDRVEEIVTLEALDDLRGLIDAVRRELVAFASTGAPTRTDREGWFEYRRLAPGTYFPLTLASRHVFNLGSPLPVEEGTTRDLQVDLDHGSKIAGRVLDPAGGPVSGVTVTAIYHPPGMASFTKIIREVMGYVNGEFLRGPIVATSGPNGEFEIDTLPNGAYDLLALREGAAPVLVDAVNTGNTGVLVVLEPGAEVSGFITDMGGSPLEGIHVRLEPTDETPQLPFPGGIAEIVRSFTSMLEEEPVETYSRADGSFVLDAVVPGSYDLRIDQPGHIPLERPVAAKQGGVTDVGTLELDPGEAVYGRVLDEGGTPIVGALVQAYPMRGQGNFMPFSTDDVTGRTRVRTGNSGQFSIGGLSKKKYGLTAHAKGFARKVVENVEVGSGTTITLGPGWQVDGIVVSGVDGQPIAGAKVRAGGELAETDSDGRFRLANVTPGDEAPGGLDFERRVREPKRVQVTVKHSDYITEREQVGKDVIDAGNARIELFPQTEVEGIVKGPDGAGLVGALVQVVPPEDAPEFLSDTLFTNATVTDLEGRFRMKMGGSIDFGSNMRLKASHPQYSAAFSDNVKAEKGQPAPFVEMSLVSGGRVEGVVRDGEYPLQGVQVRLGRDAGDNEQGMIFAMMGIPSGGRKVFTDEEGRFLFERVTPGAYDVEAKGVQFAASDTQKITLADGGSVSLEFTLDPGGVVEGIVVDQGRNPLAGARVKVFQENDELSREMGTMRGEMMRRMIGASLATTATDDFGMFRAVGIPRETMVVRAELDGFVPGEVTGVVPESGTIEVVLVPEARIDGIVREAGSGRPVTEFKVSLRRMDEERNDEMPFLMSDRGRSFETSTGEFSFQDLEPGQYGLEVRATGYTRFQEELTLKVGERKRVKATLAESGTVRGLVLIDQTGDPLRGAQISFQSPGESGSASFFQSMMGQGTRTDKDGRFEITEIPDASEQVLVIRHQNYVMERKELHLAPGDSTDITVRMRSGFSISGIARFPNGELASQTAILLSSESGATKFAFIGEEGRFRFDGLDEGRFEISQFNQQGADTNVLTEVTVTGSRDDLEIQVEIPGGR